MTIAGNSTVNVQAAGTTFYSSGVVQLYTYVTPAQSYHIAEVSYFLDGIEVAIGSPPTYAVTLQNLAPGTHVITVKVTDDAGYVTTSTLTVSVLAGGPSVVYYYNDTAGSPIAASDQNGNVIWEELYEPYGKRHLNESGDGNGIWYTGKPVEDVTGLSYFGARWYSPSLGRFYSVDPQRFKESKPLTFNRYSYGNNNPYRYIDPDGSETVGAWIDANGVAAATSGNGLATYGWAFAATAWSVFGAESLSQIETVILPGQLFGIDFGRMKPRRRMQSNVGVLRTSTECTRVGHRSATTPTRERWSRWN